MRFVRFAVMFSVVLFLLGYARVQAGEFSFRVGGTVDVKDSLNQMKFGLGFYSTQDNPQQEASLLGLHLEGSFLSGAKKFWFTPLWGYDFAPFKFPLVLTPYMGLGLNYGSDSGRSAFSIGIKPGLRVKYFLKDTILIFMEPLIFTLEPWTYFFGDGLPSNSDTTFRASYEAMIGFGIIY